MTALSDDEIMELAGQWFHTGENQHRADGYYYRSLGTPSNVRGSDLIAFARALLAAQPAVQQPAEDDVFSALDLSPDTFRTEGGAVNVGKLRAAIRHPLDYLPAEHWLCADTVIKAQGGKQ